MYLLTIYLQKGETDEKINKSIFALTVASALSANALISAYANSSNATQDIIFLSNSEFQKNYQEQLDRFSGLSDEEVCKILVEEYGLTQEQVNLVYREYLTIHSISTYAFPSNPSVGDTYSYTTKKIALPSDSDKRLMALISACSAIPNPYVAAFENNPI